MGYAFISYSSRQYATMLRLRELLEEESIETWAAPEDIPLGGKYSEVIKKAIENASCMILLLSNDAQNSVYCELEVGLALKMGKFIVPIQIEDIQLNDAFTLYLSNREVYSVPGFSTARRDYTRAVAQLRLLCHEKAAPSEEEKPRKGLAAVRRGTWLQLGGLLWLLLSFWPLGKYITFLDPYTGTHEYGDYHFGTMLAIRSLHSTCIWLLLWFGGLVPLLHGFNLNRLEKGRKGSFFRLLTPAQICLLGFAFFFSVFFALSMAMLTDYRVLSPDWWDYLFCASWFLWAALLAASLVLCLAGLVKKLFRRIRAGKAAK